MTETLKPSLQTSKLQIESQPSHLNGTCSPIGGYETVITIIDDDDKITKSDQSARSSAEPTSRGISPAQKPLAVDDTTVAEEKPTSKGKQQSQKKPVVVNKHRTGNFQAINRIQIQNAKQQYSPVYKLSTQKRSDSNSDGLSGVQMNTTGSALGSDQQLNFQLRISKLQPYPSPTQVKHVSPQATQRGEPVQKLANNKRHIVKINSLDNAPSTVGMAEDQMSGHYYMDAQGANLAALMDSQGGSSIQKASQPQNNKKNKQQNLTARANNNTNQQNPFKNNQQNQEHTPRSHLGGLKENSMMTQDPHQNTSFFTTQEGGAQNGVNNTNTHLDSSQWNVDAQDSLMRSTMRVDGGGTVGSEPPDYSMGCAPNPAVKIPSTFRNTSIYFNSRMWPRNLRKEEAHPSSVVRSPTDKDSCLTSRTAYYLKRPGGRAHPDWFDKKVPSMLHTKDKKDEVESKFKVAVTWEPKKCEPPPNLATLRPQADHLLRRMLINKTQQEQAQTKNTSMTDQSNLDNQALQSETSTNEPKIIPLSSTDDLPLTQEEEQTRIKKQQQKCKWPHVLQPQGIYAKMRPLPVQDRAKTVAQGKFQQLNSAGRETADSTNLKVTTTMTGSRNTRQNGILSLQAHSLEPQNDAFFVTERPFTQDYREYRDNNHLPPVSTPSVFPQSYQHNEFISQDDQEHPSSEQDQIYAQLRAQEREHQRNIVRAIASQDGPYRHVERFEMKDLQMTNNGRDPISSQVERRPQQQKPPGSKNQTQAIHKKYDIYQQQMEIMKQEPAMISQFKFDLPPSQRNQSIDNISQSNSMYEPEYGSYDLKIPKPRARPLNELKKQFATIQASKHTKEIAAERQRGFSMQLIQKELWNKNNRVKLRKGSKEINLSNIAQKVMSKREKAFLSTMPVKPDRESQKLLNGEEPVYSNILLTRNEYEVAHDPDDDDDVPMCGNVAKTKAIPTRAQKEKEADMSAIEAIEADIQARRLKHRMENGFDRTGSYEELLDKFDGEGVGKFIESIKNRDPKACDLELLKKMQEAKNVDLKYEAFDVSPLNIGQGEALLKMQLMERMTLEELGYSIPANKPKQKMNLKTVANLMKKQLEDAAAERERANRKNKKQQ